MQDVFIRDSQGRIIGRILTDGQGNKVVKDSAGRILGRYEVITNTTRDSAGRIVARGDAASSLIPR